MGRVIRGRSPVTSMSYHESGSHLFVASEVDSTLRVVDCLREADVAGGGMPSWPPMMKMQNEGIRIVKSTHHGHCVLFSPGGNSDGVPRRRRTDVIYYHSVHDNKILREFGGHAGGGGGHINGICMSPVNDTFLSSSVDGIVR
jgi:WD40 repeat protein